MRSDSDTHLPDRSPTAQAMQQAAESQLAIAFLDAYLLHDALAHRWLSSQAHKWLSSVGELSIK